MATVPFEPQERTSFLDHLKRQIKRKHRDSGSSLKLTQFQHVVSQDLGFPAWNLLSRHVETADVRRLWDFLELCEKKGWSIDWIADDDDGDIDFEEYWFDGVGD